MNSPAVLDIASAFPAVVKRSKAKSATARYHEHLSAIGTLQASGVYAIIDASTRQVLYVGESHTGRLYDTITRHFRKWTPEGGGSYRDGRRRGGHHYQRGRVLVAYVITPSADAQTLQYAEIQRLTPRDNDVDGSGVVDPSGVELPV